MIADQCFTSEWQARKREELGGCDPVLLEKTIHASPQMNTKLTCSLNIYLQD
jgi:hypothetical protein